MTTLLDYYGLPGDVPGVADRPARSPRERVEHVERVESIKETPSGAPSKRIAAHLDRYRKVVHGPLAAADIGLDRIRAACPHFAAWLSWLEGLGEPSGAEAGEPTGGETG